MRWSILTLGFCVAMASAGLSQGFAQEKLPPPDNVKTPDKESIKKIPGPTKLQNAAGMIGDMKRSLKSVSALLEQAEKKERNIAKINCVNSKLLSIKGFVKVSEQSYVQLKDSVSSKDNESSNHNYLLIALANDKVARLNDEARLCVGESAEIDERGEASYTASSDIASVEPFNSSGQLFDSEINGGLLDPDKIPELTPFQ